MEAFDVEGVAALAGNNPVNGGQVPRMQRYLVLVVVALGFLIYGFEQGLPGAIGGKHSMVDKPKIETRRVAESPTTTSIYCRTNKLSAYSFCFYLGTLGSSIFTVPIHRILGSQACVIIGSATLFGTSFLSLAFDDDEEGRPENMIRILSGVGAGTLFQVLQLFLVEKVPDGTFSRHMVNLNQVARFGVIVIDTLVLSGGGWEVIGGVKFVFATILLFVMFCVGGKTLVNDWIVNESTRNNNQSQSQTSMNQLLKAKIYGALPALKALGNRRCRIQLTFAVVMPILQQLRGMSTFGPGFHRTLCGYHPSTALLVDVGCNAVSILATFGSIWLVERRGWTWRTLFSIGSLIMFFSHCSISELVHLQKTPLDYLDLPVAISVSIFVAVFYAGYGLSWGPSALAVSMRHLRLRPEVRTSEAILTFLLNFASCLFISYCITHIQCALGPHYLYFALSSIMFFILGFTVILLPDTTGDDDHMPQVLNDHVYWAQFHQE